MRTSSLAIDPTFVYRWHFIALAIFAGLLLYATPAAAQTTTDATTTLAYPVATTATTTSATTSVPVMPVNMTTGFTRDLELGMAGTDVTALQTYLALDTVIYPEGLITGYFGSLTQAAVNRFQARYGIAQVGRAGPITRAKINGLIGASDVISTPPFGTGGSDDLSAPIMSASTVTPSATSASITWTTNEDAWSRVMYGAAWPFLYANAPDAKDPSFDSSTSVTLTNLTPNTNYYFVRESIDASGNLMWSSAEQFHTL